MEFGNSGLNFDWLIPILVIFPGEKHKVIGGSALEFFVGDGFDVLGIVFADTWIVSSDDDVP